MYVLEAQSVRLQSKASGLPCHESVEDCGDSYCNTFVKLVVDLTISFRVQACSFNSRLRLIGVRRKFHSYIAVTIQLCASYHLEGADLLRCL